MSDSEKNSLLPINASGFEQSLEQSCNRVSDVPVAIRDVWSSDTCPTDLLPYLAWAFSVDEWNSEWSETIKRRHVKNAIRIHRIKGTRGAVDRGIENFETVSSIKENFEYAGIAQAPNNFMLELPIDELGAQDPEILQEIINSVNRNKRVSSHFELRQTVSITNSFVGINAQMRVFKVARIRAVDDYVGSVLNDLVLAKNPLVYWAINEVGNTLKDYTENGLDLVLSGGSPIYTENTLKCELSGRSLIMGSTIGTLTDDRFAHDAANEYTIEFWFSYDGAMTESWDVFCWVSGSNAAELVRVYPGGKVYLNFWNGATYSLLASPTSANEVHHAVITYHYGDGYKIYIDGVLDVSDATTLKSNIAYSTDVVMNRDVGDMGSSVELYGFAYYNDKSLTQEEITDHYDASIIVDNSFNSLLLAKNPTIYHNYNIADINLGSLTTLDWLQDPNTYINSDGVKVTNQALTTRDLQDVPEDDIRLQTDSQSILAVYNVAANTLISQVFGNNWGSGYNATITALSGKPIVAAGSTSAQWAANDFTEGLYFLLASYNHGDTSLSIYEGMLSGDTLEHTYHGAAGGSASSLETDFPVYTNTRYSGVELGAEVSATAILEYCTEAEAYELFQAFKSDYLGNDLGFNSLLLAKNPTLMWNYNEMDTQQGSIVAEWTVDPITYINTDGVKVSNQSLETLDIDGSTIFNSETSGTALFIFSTVSDNYRQLIGNTTDGGNDVTLVGEYPTGYYLRANINGCGITTTSEITWNEGLMFLAITQQANTDVVMYQGKLDGVSTLSVTSVVGVGESKAHYNAPILQNNDNGTGTAISDEISVFSVMDYCTEAEITAIFNKFKEENGV